MTDTVPLIVIVLKTVTLLIGGFVTYLAGSAAHDTGRTGLSYLAIGFGVVTSGALLAGVGDQLLLISTAHALVLENALTTVGFAVIGYSLYVTRQRSVV